jgi:hypothetical protein
MSRPPRGVSPHPRIPRRLRTANTVGRHCRRRSILIVAGRSCNRLRSPPAAAVQRSAWPYAAASEGIVLSSFRICLLLVPSINTRRRISAHCSIAVNILHVNPGMPHLSTAAPHGATRRTFQPPFTRFARVSEFCRAVLFGFRAGTGRWFGLR